MNGCFLPVNGERLMGMKGRVGDRVKGRPETQ